MAASSLCLLSGVVHVADSSHASSCWRRAEYGEGRRRRRRRWGCWRRFPATLTPGSCSRSWRSEEMRMMAAIGLAPLQATLSPSLTPLPAHRQPPRLCLVYIWLVTLPFVEGFGIPRSTPFFWPRRDSINWGGGSLRSTFYYRVLGLAPAARPRREHLVFVFVSRKNTQAIDWQR